jgi:hypothetical protein
MKQTSVNKLSKNKPLKNLFRLLILSCFIYCNTVTAQNCLDEIYNNKLYSNSNDIINGKKWINEKRYSGSPLLMENYWPIADISYNGSVYKGIQMNYNVYKNDLIVYHPVKGTVKYVVLSKDILSGFSFTDTVSNRKCSYEYIELPGIKGKALYENASVGKVSLFIKPTKIIEHKSVDSELGEFFNFYEYYLNSGNGYYSFRSKSQFLKLFENHVTELKRYIRKNSLKINNQHPENVIAVLRYFDGLN